MSIKSNSITREKAAELYSETKHRPWTQFSEFVECHIQPRHLDLCGVDSDRAIYLSSRFATDEQMQEKAQYDENKNKQDFYARLKGYNLPVLWKVNRDARNRRNQEYADKYPRLVQEEYARIARIKAENEKFAKMGSTFKKSCVPYLIKKPSEYARYSARFNLLTPTVADYIHWYPNDSDYRQELEKYQLTETKVRL